MAGPTIVNLINLILSNLSVNNQWFLVPNLVLSHVYGCSLLYSVNARKTMGLRTTIMSSKPPVGQTPGTSLPTPLSQIVASIFRTNSKREVWYRFSQDTALLTNRFLKKTHVPLEDRSQGSTASEGFVNVQKVERSDHVCRHFHIIHFFIVFYLIVNL